MKLPAAYFELNPCDYIEGEQLRKYHTLRALAAWTDENKPEEIEMTEKQFWNFTTLQPLPMEERYWNTFHGIPLRCPEMSVAQQINLRLNV
jgi:hypothetical protein